MNSPRKLNGCVLLGMDRGSEQGLEDAIELSYTYEKGEKYLVGHLDGYPEYPTQGEDIKDLEEHLEEIYRWIQDGTLEPKYHGILKIA